MVTIPNHHHCHHLNGFRPRRDDQDVPVLAEPCGGFGFYGSIPDGSSWRPDGQPQPARRQDHDTTVSWSDVG